VGSRSKCDLAYIAGFLDGDGSLMLQIKKRKDGKIGLRFMATICFYQDTRHEKPLHWIRDVLKIGYVSRRNDGISELRVNGYQRVKSVLRKLLTFIKFKEVQARALFAAVEILSEKEFQKLSEKELRRLVALTIIIQNNNYVTKKKRTEKELLAHLGLTP
jgi:hypothetical protein